jgi:hypothetical protein
MSENIRQQNEGILDWLRRLSSRVDRLEKGDKGVRINDSRLGDLVLRPNRDTNQIEATNLVTGDMTPISGVREAIWSWPGELFVSGVGEENLSPPYAMADTTVANEIVIAKGGDPIWRVCIGVIFPGGLEIVSAINPGDTIKVRPINIPLSRNDLVRVRLIGVSNGFEGGPMNVSVAVRFGQPNEYADNTTLEGGGYCAGEL